MTCASVQMFGKVSLESLISWASGKEIISLDIFIILVAIL